MKTYIRDHSLEIFHENKNENAILWLMGKHERENLSYIESHLDCMLIVLEIENWNDDLSPWSASVFKNNDFKGYGHQTYELIVEEIIPFLQKHFSYHHLFIVGYSMAGMFSLYTFCQNDLFEGAASCSGSLWYPGFVDFVKMHHHFNKKIYLSLGNKEHKSKNRILNTVKEKTKCVYQILKNNNHCFYQINIGNHFQNIDQRLLLAMKWLIEKGK